MISDFSNTAPITELSTATPIADVQGKVRGRLALTGAPRHSTWQLIALRTALVAIAYYGSARIGLLLAFEHSNVTPVWPPSGIAVAGLLILGLRYWPALLASAFFVNLTTGLSPSVSVGLAVGNTLEYVLAVWLLQRFAFDQGLRRIRDVAILAVAGALLSPVVAASMGTASLLLGGVIPRAAVATVWTVYLVGDGVGILVFTPLVLIWSRGTGSLRAPRLVVAEVAFLGLSVLALCGSVFLGALNRAYLIYPLAIWAVVRFGQKGATAVLLVVSSLAVWGTVHGVGPFSAGSTTERLANLQTFLAAFGFTALSLGAAVLAQCDSEHKVFERSTQLEATNRELEAFAYTVAHDLRAPLRAIDGFARALVHDFPDHLAGDMGHRLDRIATNAVQMGRLIDALLDFARLGPQRLNLQLLMPKMLAELALERLLSGAPERQMEIAISDLPPCSADPALLSLVYQNLLDNALKFTRDREVARIEVGWMPNLEEHDFPIYFVRDNGAGFDMRYADKLFVVFQRLHRQTQFTGTGAGLAIVKRIVIKHGGRIWAQAEKNQGAVFFFTLGSKL